MTTLNLTEHTQAEAREKSTAGGWWGVLGAPAIWGAQQVGIYAFNQWTCLSGTHWMLYVVSIVCLVGTVITALISWRSWKKAGGESPEETDGGPVARSRFLGFLGMVTSVLFFIVILAQGIPAFFFDSCWA